MIPRVCDSRCKPCAWCDAGRYMSTGCSFPPNCERCGDAGVEHSADCDARRDDDRRDT